MLSPPNTKASELLYWSVALVASSALVKGVSAGVILLMAAWLKPETYAKMGLLYSIQSAMGVMAGVGVAERTIGQLKRYDSRARAQALYRRATGLFFSVALMAIVPVALVTLKASGGLGIGLGAVCAVLLGGLNAFALLQANFLRLEERFADSLYASMLIPLATSVGFIASLAFTANINGMFLWALGGALCGFGILAFTKRVHVVPPLQWRRLKKEVVYIAPFGVLAVFGWLSGYGMNVIIGDIFSSAEVAQFTFLLTVSSLAQMIGTAMNMAWTPRFYKLFNQGGDVEAEAQSRRYYAGVAIVLALVGATGVAILPFVARLGRGNLLNYQDLDFELALMFTGYILSIPWWHVQNYYHVTSSNRRLMNLSLGYGTVAIGVWLMAMHFFGALGIFLGFALQAGIKSVGASWPARRQWKVRPPWVVIMAACLVVFGGLLTRL